MKAEDILYKLLLKTTIKERGCMQIKKLINKKLGLLVAASLFLTNNVSAITIDPNSSYNILSGSFGIVLSNESGQDYYLNVSSNSTFGDGNDTVSIGGQTGNHLDNVTLNTSFSMSIYKYDVATGTLDTSSTYGTVDGDVVGNRSNILKSSTEDVAGGKLGEASGGLLFMNFAGNSTEFGGDFNFSFVGNQKFTNNLAPGTSGGVYDNLIALTGGSFSLALGDTGVNTYDVFKTWYMSQLNGVTINGNAYTAYGDIHSVLGSNAQVPEPATMSLLGLGALGAVRRRRKAVVAN